MCEREGGAFQERTFPSEHPSSLSPGRRSGSECVYAPVSAPASSVLPAAAGPGWVCVLCSALSCWPALPLSPLLLLFYS